MMTPKKLEEKLKKMTREERYAYWNEQMWRGLEKFKNGTKRLQKVNKEIGELIKNTKNR